MLRDLRLKNKDIEIYSVNSPEFKTYGNIITEINTTEITEKAKEFKFPENGSIYSPIIDDFENLDTTKDIKSKFFGEQKIQVGYCYGHNNFLNGTEWHKSNEINIAVTPFVLLMAHIWDIDDSIIDSVKFKALYVPKGTMFEVYATTLHFCPCQINDDGFGCVVILPKGTNTPLENRCENPLLFRKNKWLLAHIDNKELITKGVKAGVTGENYKIKY